MSERIGVTTECSDLNGPNQVLAEGAKEAGHHRVRFDGRGLPAGVYVVRLTAGGAADEFVGTARVTLLR